MARPDLNLLIALDYLLEEGSVVGAARRMHLSAPAMSRTLARLRETVGDPLLVKVGRRMELTPRALLLREQVRGAVERASEVLAPQGELDLASLRRSFAIQANDTFVSAYGGALLERLRNEAPQAVLRYLPERHDDSDVLLDERVDLWISAMSSLRPDVHMQALFSTHFVGVARRDHPIFEAPLTPDRWVQFDHVSVSRRGRTKGPIDIALAEHGLQRRVSLVTANFHTGVFALARSDLLLALPEHVARMLGPLGMALRSFELPIELPPVSLAQAWHPRHQADPAHRWLRRTVRAVCTDSTS